MNDYPPEYDQETPDNSIVEAAFADYTGPGKMYRSIYKYTATGPSVGFCIRYVEVLPPDGFDDYPHEIERERWMYCDELYRLGSWADMAHRGELIVAVSVSSIVEGVDTTTDIHEVLCDPDYLMNRATPDEIDSLHETLKRLFDRALALVEAEADEIWQATHGCETCAKHWASIGITEAMYGPMEGCDGATHIWKDCPDCEGAGVVV